MVWCARLDIIQQFSERMERATGCPLFHRSHFHKRLSFGWLCHASSCNPVLPMIRIRPSFDTHTVQLVMMMVMMRMMIPLQKFCKKLKAKLSPAQWRPPPPKVFKVICHELTDSGGRWTALCLRGGRGLTWVTWRKGEPLVGRVDRHSQDAEWENWAEGVGAEGVGEALGSSARPTRKPKLHQSDCCHALHRDLPRLYVRISKSRVVCFMSYKNIFFFIYAYL